MNKKELDYYDEFIKNAEIAAKMAQALKDYTEDFDFEKAANLEAEIHKYENEADNNLHIILNYLIKDFLPPIEREDIVSLANKIDDMIDCIDELVINIDILGIKSLRNDFRNFIELINSMCTKQFEMMQNFKKTKKYEEIHSMVVTINNLEGNGDEIYEQAIKELYKTETNTVEILKWNTIYNSAENCFDSLENVANTIDEIMMKNS